MRESVIIINQCLSNLPKGPIKTNEGKITPPPKKEIIQLSGFLKALKKHKALDQVIEIKEKDDPNKQQSIMIDNAKKREVYQINKTNEVILEIDAESSAPTPYVEMSFGMGVENYPAICMTQHAAIKFCEWLSALTGKFYRLPTEAEWEYACRAGTSSSYSFGDNIEDLYEYGWFKSNSNDSYNKVKQKKPNPWGLYDMHGNVSEWTLDQYIPTIYRTRKQLSVDPFEVPNKVYPKTVRGGSWMDNPSRLRSASRRPSSKKWKKRDGASKACAKCNA